VELVGYEDEEAGRSLRLQSWEVHELYSIAVEKYTTYNDMDDILLYMKMCYEYTKKMQPENEYVYYKKVLANDYENFIAQINTGYFIDKL